MRPRRSKRRSNAPCKRLDAESIVAIVAGDGSVSIRGSNTLDQSPIGHECAHNYAQVSIAESIAETTALIMYFPLRESA